MNRRSRGLATGLICFLSTLGTLTAEAAGAPTPNFWSGIFAPPAGATATQARVLEVKVFSLSTDQEIETLVAALRRGGQLALREEMAHLENRGWVRIDQAGAATVAVVRRIDLDDGGMLLRVFCASPIRVLDRPEAEVGTADYPFSYLELQVDAHGRGEGKLIAAATIEIQGEGIAIGTAGVPVIRVSDVLAETVK